MRSERSAGGAARRIALLLALSALALPLPAQEQAEPRGMALYRQYCAQCHGDEGDGRGVAAPRLLPRPRDFTAAKFKVRSTPTGELPTDADLRRVIREGLPYSTMPAFDWMTQQQVASLIEVVKGFSGDFQDPELAPEPLDLPDPPAYDAERAASEGRQVYEQTGCARCHGELGRGDGPSAPTLVDDQGDPIPPADLTMRWTFRGGGSRADIFRTMATGFNGTPMPGFAGSLTEEQIWAITDYIASLSWHDPEDPYDDLVKAVAVAGEIDLEAADELFDEAPAALFPVVGQVIQPGREFHPAVLAVQAQAIYNDEEIAVRLVWHDRTADRSGENAPDLPVERQPLVPDAEGEAAPEQETGAEDFWGGAATGAAPSEEGEATDAAAFFTEAAAPVAAAAPESPYSDAVAIQIPRQAVQGIRRPYFLFGDLQNAVELWFADLATPEAVTYVARGSDAVERTATPELAVVSSYEDGAWTVTFKRPRRPAEGQAFEEGAFVPIAFSVWDGLTGEHGSKRGLTRWFSIYLEPGDKPSPAGPMLRAGLGVLGIELLIIGAAGWYKRRRDNTPSGG